MIVANRARRPGKIVALVALSLSVVVGVLALNLDGGGLFAERRRNQDTADAAALAAGDVLYENYRAFRGLDVTGAARAAALKVATANGVAEEDVAVHIPPTSGTFAGQPGHVEVKISTRMPASFGRIFSGESNAVAARSVAQGEPMKLGILALRESGPAAFHNKALALTVVNTPIIVNSDDPAAFTQQSFGAVVASSVRVTGGIRNPGGAIMLMRRRTGVAPTPDPLARLPIPATGGLSLRSAAPLTINSLLPTFLQPGVYRGGIRIIGASVVTMSAGVYVMEGGGFVVDGLATVVGLGVMVYNSTSPTYADGPIAVTSVGKVTLVAPLDGVYQGINFFQNRNNTQPVTMSGVGLAAITGTVYAPRAAAKLSGLAAVGLDILGGAWVVDTMTVEGVGAVNIDLKLNPPRIPDVRVVE